MKTIIISENKRDVLLNAILKESMDQSDKILMVKKYLDDNFSRADQNIFDDNGHPVNKQVVVWLTPNKEPVKTLRSDQLFYVLQEQFKDILADKNERDELLKKIIKAWYNHNITKVGTIIDKN